jgi:hypothetical protein
MSYGKNIKSGGRHSGMTLRQLLDAYQNGSLSQSTLRQYLNDHLLDDDPEGKKSKIKKVSDLYEILGVQEEATEDEIKRAYYRLAKEYHPDALGGDRDKFQRAQKAYIVLGDKDKREKYDALRLLNVPKQQPLHQPSPGPMPFGGSSVGGGISGFSFTAVWSMNIPGRGAVTGSAVIMPSGNYQSTGAVFLHGSSTIPFNFRKKRP